MNIGVELKWVVWNSTHTLENSLSLLKTRRVDVAVEKCSDRTAAGAKLFDKIGLRMFSVCAKAVIHIEAPLNIIR